jgi:hypothetical protein
MTFPELGRALSRPAGEAKRCWTSANFITRGNGLEDIAPASPAPTSTREASGSSARGRARSPPGPGKALPAEAFRSLAGVNARPGFEIAICPNGHIAAFDDPDELYAPVAERATPACPRCGRTILLTCPTCDVPIRARYSGPGGLVEPSDFCDQCGDPFPWVGRQGLIYELEKRLEEDELDDPTRRAVHDELEGLRQARPGSEEEVARFQAIKRLAPRAWDFAAPIIGGLISAEARMKLGLPPG